jgi:hypothetical protein
MDGLAAFQAAHPIAYKRAMDLARQHHLAITAGIQDGSVITLYYGVVQPPVPLGCRRFARRRDSCPMITC